MTRTCVLLLAGAAMAALVGGCVVAKAPETIEVPGYSSSPPPPSFVSKANPNDKADLVRENGELRQRVAWLEDQNRRLAKKYKDQEHDMDSIRSDMNKIASERDRYRRAAGE